MSGRWKFLVVSIVAYQALLTWCMFDLVDTASYFSRLDCGDWCRSRMFGYILTNQGASDTADLWLWGTILLVLVNLGVWIGAALGRRAARREAARANGGELSGG